MPGCHQLYLKLMLSAAVLLGLTACSLSLDAQANHSPMQLAECQLLFAIRRAHEQQNRAAYEQLVPDDEFTATAEFFMESASISEQTADTLAAFTFTDKNLQGLSAHTVDSLRQTARFDRRKATFAEIERTITSANDRSPEHQALVVAAAKAGETYGGMGYALEVYCKEGKIADYLTEPPAQKEPNQV